MGGSSELILPWSALQTSSRVNLARFTGSLIGSGLRMKCRERSDKTQRATRPAEEATPGMEPHPVQGHGPISSLFSRIVAVKWFYL